MKKSDILYNESVDFIKPYGQFSNRDLLDLAWLLGFADARDVLEIGCWTGNSTAAICMKVNGQVTVIDTFNGRGSVLESFAINTNVKDIFIKNMNNIGFIGKIRLLHGTSDDMAKYVPESSQDIYPS